MIDPRLVLTAFFLYVALLFSIAIWAEKRAKVGKSLANNAIVYSLSLAVYCTAWTYYGSVGKAATSGMLFLPMYLGPTLCILLWWGVLRKLVRLKNAYRITSIADFISARYNKSEPLAAIATFIAILGVMPYIALQLKAIISTFIIITHPTPDAMYMSRTASAGVSDYVGPVVVILMIAFTIMLGARRLDPTERHEGMMMALAVECLVKLLAFLAAGIFVTYFMFKGFTDIFQRFNDGSHNAILKSWGFGAAPYFTWTTYLILSMSAILFLPRQFHVAVVENSDEKHILTAMWLFPLYMLLINIFVLPIAMGGLLKGYGIQTADSYVLLLPLHHGKAWLSLLVFIGGVSAAAGMIMVSSVTIATMITNHLLLPLTDWVPWVGFLKKHLLKCRWVAIAAFIAAGYWFEEQIIKPYMLVSIGLISFSAVIQFAPAVLGGLYWRKGNRAGAMLGLSAGSLVWCYTQLLPSFIRNGWLPADLLEKGPWGVRLLRPEGLLGLSDLDALSHTLVWSMLFNVTFYVLGSLFFEQTKEERGIAEEFVGVLVEPPSRSHQRRGDVYIDLDAKAGELELLLGQYFPESKAAMIVEKSLEELGLKGRHRISIEQLVELQSHVEKSLAGSIGSAAAYKAMRQGTIFTPRESRELSEFYAEILANLRVTPGELKAKIDYYQEREVFLIQQANELEEKIKELEREIRERKRVQKALRESEEQFRGLVEAMNEGLEIEDEKGTIIYVNDKLCRMWGCAREDILGSSITKFLDESQHKSIAGQLSRCHTGETSSYETTWTDGDGNKVHAIVSSVPLFDSEGQYKGSFSVITDISNIRSLEREKANMISMFAHDMRSSLTGIHGLGLRLLSKSATIDEEKRNEYLRIINKEASKLESLVDDFLEFSRLETGRLKLNFRAVSLDKELMELFEIYQPRATQKGIELSIQLTDTLPIIEADINRLRRVFTNLLDNALKFSKEKGKVTIAAQEHANEVIVKIMDEGIGIDPDELPYIFDIFHKVHTGEKREGYGIGLATVKAIVEGHGGRVKVESEPGKGSVFTVFLPKAGRHAEP